jgi:hypothetical protein
MDVKRMRGRGQNTCGSGYEQMGAVGSTIMNFSSIKCRTVLIAEELLAFPEEFVAFS